MSLFFFLMKGFPLKKNYLSTVEVGYSNSFRLVTLLIWKGRMFLHLIASRLVPLTASDRAWPVDFILKVSCHNFPEHLYCSLLRFSLLALHIKTGLCMLVLLTPTLFLLFPSLVFTSYPGFLKFFILHNTRISFFFHIPGFETIVLTTASSIHLFTTWTSGIVRG